MVLKYLLQKEFLQMRRNAFIPRLIVMFPIMMMCVMPRGENPQIFVAANAVNGTKGTMGSSYMANIITGHIASAVEKGGVSSAASALVSVLYLYNKYLNYKVFVIPSLMAILILLMCGFLPALNIVGEKESGPIEAMNVTPVRKWEFILAKLIPYWLMGMVVMTVCFILAWAVYGIVMWFVVMCLLLLSGLFTPVRSMPHWAYLTTYVNPVHYFIDAIRTVFVRGGDFSSISHQVLTLGGIAFVMNVWAVASYRKNS